MQVVLLQLAVGALLLAQVAAGRVETLALPHSLRTGESAWIEVQLGAVPHGTEIELETASGRLLGVISPFGVRAGNQAGTYTVPLPSDAISNGRVSIRLLLKHYQSQRAPTLQEVKSVRVRISDPPEKH